MKTSLTILLSVFALPAAAALSFHCTPGALRSHISENGIPEDRSIIITGSLNVVDLLDLAALDIESLDISACSIVSYSSSKPHLYGRYVFSADEIPDYAFAGTKINHLVLPAGVIRIGHGAFLGSSLKSITISDGTKSIGDYAMRDCALLTKISFPQSLTEIGKECFAGCVNLEKLDIANTSITTIPERIVAGCDALVSISWPKTITSVSTLAMADSKVLSLSLQQQVDAGAFALAHTPLKYAHLQLSHPEKATGILFNSSDLKGMDYKWHAIPDAAFAGIPKADINYISEASHIGDYAFYGNLHNLITLTEGITSLGDQVFGNVPVTKINAVALKDNIPAVTERTFEGLNQEKVMLVVSNESVAEWEAADIWCRFDIVPEMNSVNNILADAFSISLRNGILSLSADREILEVKVTDESGLSLGASAPHASTATCSVSDSGGRILIVTTRFADSQRTDKILR